MSSYSYRRAVKEVDGYDVVFSAGMSSEFPLYLSVLNR
jgi:hypothetical protein